MVRTCSSSTVELRRRPHSVPPMATWVGRGFLLARLVTAAAITVGLCRLPVSFCMMSTGLTPPCSLPITGVKSA